VNASFSAAPAVDQRPRFPFRLLWFWWLRLLPGWSLIAVMIFLFQIAICGIVHDNQNVKALLAFVQVLPPFIKSMLGGPTLRPDNTAALIGIGYQHPFVLILFMIYAVGTPTGLLVGEIQRGGMELILSRPVTKTQVYLCAAVPSLAGMFLLTLAMFLGTVAGTSLFRFGKPVPLDGFFRVAVNGGCMAAAAGSIALLVSSWSRDRGRAVAGTVAYLVIDYFAHLISSWWPMMKPLQRWTLFCYVNGPKVFLEGLWPLREMGVLAALAAGAALAGWYFWRRRDLAA